MTAHAFPLPPQGSRHRESELLVVSDVMLHRAPSVSTLSQRAGVHSATRRPLKVDDHGNRGCGWQCVNPSQELQLSDFPLPPMLLFSSQFIFGEVV